MIVILSVSIIIMFRALEKSSRWGSDLSSRLLWMILTNYVILSYLSLLDITRGC